MKYRSWIVILLALLYTAPVYGQEDVWQYGRNFKGWEIKSLTITGLPAGVTSDLRKGLALAEDGAVLYEKTLREDIGRIALFMAKIGYPYTTVSLDVEPSDSKRKIHLALEVDTGPAVRVTGVTVRGIPDGVTDRSIRVLPFVEGDIFVESLQQQYNETALEAMQEAGYARATVSASLVWSDTVTVAVEVDVTPGAVYHFRRVEASGASDNLMGLVYTMADIHPGDRFHPDLLTDAREYLSKLGLFRQIRLDITDVPPDSLDLHIVVSERRFRSVEFGAGYWSDEKFSGRLGWKNRNLLRRGRGASFEIVATEFRQYLEALTWWPAIFGAKRSMWTFRLGINNENEESYEKRAPGVGTTISYLFTRSTGGTFGYFVERASYEVKTTEQPLFQETDGLVSWFETRFTRDATNDRVTPERGSFSWLRIQWGPAGGVSESDWILSELSGTIHIPLKERMLIAVNVRAGAAKPLGNAQVLLPDKRFYEGGSVSHRGFGRRKLGPKDENGLPLGGEVMTTGFVEYRFPFIWNFEGALFTDWGQVWQTADDVNVRNVEVAIGPGLRLATPVGPFRLDWGWRVTNHDTSVSRWALHFAIGYPM